MVLLRDDDGEPRRYIVARAGDLRHLPRFQEDGELRVHAGESGGKYERCSFGKGQRKAAEAGGATTAEMVLLRDDDGEPRRYIVARAGDLRHLPRFQEDGELRVHAGESSEKHGESDFGKGKREATKRSGASDGVGNGRSEGPWKGTGHRIIRSEGNA
mmetsp:Transcript_779/g.1757  ORF Transcript_779/g.1757 Transcript_779/m.1757 type:complete len:158 (-) Transcript_779:1-474(-)